MMTYTCTALAHPNIALIKYWGNRDEKLRLPANGSISMNLSGLHTITSVQFDEEFPEDSLEINQKIATGRAVTRVSQFLDEIRKITGISMFAQVSSHNNFPIGAGIASSASAFASLSLAASQALGLSLPENELSRLARRGSGSACRSIPPGFVEWLPGEIDNDSYAYSFAAPEAWELADCIALVQKKKKEVGSTEGHSLAVTSPFQPTRITDTPRRLKVCKEAIHEKDFDKLAWIVEQDSNMMHAVMLTSQPSLIYWNPASIILMKRIPLWRREGLPVCYTIDAGANVHVLTLQSYRSTVSNRILTIPEVLQVITANVGGGANILESGSIINSV